MTQFLRAQLASLAATLVDSLLTVALVEGFAIWYGAAGVAGNLGGAVTSFALGRFWVFNKSDKSGITQAARYFTMWMGYVILNFLLLVLLTEVFTLDYRVGKITTTLVIGVAYSYVMQRKFVFQ